MRRGCVLYRNFLFSPLFLFLGFFGFLCLARRREKIISLFFSLFSFGVEREKQREKKEKGIRVYFVGKDECDASSQEHCFWSILCF